jgi:hypothetical protein
VTLATLILLSYTKLLQTITTAFSFATLVYPDGSKDTLWLPGATMEYVRHQQACNVVLYCHFHSSSWLHLISFALFVAVASLLTSQEDEWSGSETKIKLSSFVEICHIPYKPKHCYWTAWLTANGSSQYNYILFQCSTPVVIQELHYWQQIYCDHPTSLHCYTVSIRIYKN